MTKPNQRRSNLVVTILLSAAAIGYVVFVFLPGQAAIGRLRDETHEKQQYIIQADRLATAVQLAEQEIEAAQSFVHKWQADAPAEDRLADFFAAVNDAASRAGLTISRFDPQPAVQLDTVWHKPVSIGWEGQFSQSFDFVQQLEQMPATLWISDLKFETAAANPGRERDRAAPAASTGSTIRAELTLWVFADNRDISN